MDPVKNTIYRETIQTNVNPNLRRTINGKKNAVSIIFTIYRFGIPHFLSALAELSPRVRKYPLGEDDVTVWRCKS